MTDCGICDLEGLEGTEPAGAEGNGRDALPGTGGFADGWADAAETFEFGATVGIIPVVEGGTGVPGVDN